MWRQRWGWRERKVARKREVRKHPLCLKKKKWCSDFILNWLRMQPEPLGSFPSKLSCRIRGWKKSQQEMGVIERTHLICGSHIQGWAFLKNPFGASLASRPNYEVILLISFIAKKGGLRI